MSGDLRGGNKYPLPEGFVAVGRVVGLFGVRGWLKIFSYTRPRDAILKYNPWQVRTSNGWRSLTLAAGRSHGKGLVAQLEGVTDRDQAAVLIDADIAVKSEQLPSLKSGEYYWAQLEGLKVIDIVGQELGTVSRLFETGANDVMVVLGEHEQLLPFTANVIKEVDLVKGVIRVDWTPAD
jgi:16S rRNA processing protein RimM